MKCKICNFRESNTTTGKCWYCENYFQTSYNKINNEQIYWSGYREGIKLGTKIIKECINLLK